MAVLKLLVLLPQLQSCQLETFGQESHPAPATLVEQGPHRKPTKAMRIATAFVHEHTLDHAARILRMVPDLELLCLDERIADWHPQGYPRVPLMLSPSAQPDLHHLIELRLVDTRMTPSDLSTLLSMIGSNLSKIDTQRTVVFDEDDIIGFHQVVVALQPWRTTLKELSFNHMPWRRPSYTPLNTHYPRSTKNLHVFLAGTHLQDLDNRELLRQFQVLDVLRCQEQKMRESEEMAAAFRAVDVDFAARFDTP
ncbi:hypothetical protein N658DRAFT_484666 [Parathielavia hyrcaniae]|uniref:Uncharacterized protein n=1 Tax=Parathielavia hyrcaniae TaxID=113614 RepID=A0AAN6T3S0_9PEZI|nr:hypothetical protein N658DRAFT_484666 [Parathielavia hyrcaniae]